MLFFLGNSFANIQKHGMDIIEDLSVINEFHVFRKQSF